MRTGERYITIVDDFLHGHEYEVMVSAVDSAGRVQSTEDSPKATIVLEGKTDPVQPCSDLTATGGIALIALNWTLPGDDDIRGTEVWRSATDTVSTATMVAFVSSDSYTDEVGSTGRTYYYWVRARNTSGTTSAYTDSVSATTEGITATSIDDFAVTATKLYTNTVVLSGDSWTDNSPGAGSIAWNTHHVTHGGNYYSVAAGSTSDRYVYWDVGNTGGSGTVADPYTTGYSTTDDYTQAAERFCIAVNTSGSHQLVWNSSANLVVGSAFILDAAITNAKIDSLAVTGAKIANATITDGKISDLSANKLTAGTIDASVITVTNLDADNITAGSITLSRVSDSGDLAAQNTADWSTDVTGTGKPDDNADVTGSNTAKDIINLPDTPSGSGLYATGSYLGYHDGTSWKTYMDNAGNFYLGGSGGLLQFDEGTGALGLLSSASGQRVEVGSDELTFYDGSNNQKVKIYTGTGGWMLVGDTGNDYVWLDDGYINIVNGTGLPFTVQRANSTNDDLIKGYGYDSGAQESVFTVTTTGSLTIGRPGGSGGDISMQGSITLNASETVDGVDVSEHAANTTTLHLPDQTGHSGEYLTTNGSVASWAAGGGGVTDHGALTGLADDDHSQYLNTTRHTALSGAHVTNGDSHNHSGGDGGTIAYSSLSGTPTIPTIEDTAVNGHTTVGISSNWAWDHDANSSAHHTKTAVSDTPTSGSSSVAISRGWAYDHVNASNPHGTGYSDLGSHNNTYHSTNYATESAFNSHNSRHENGGADEIEVTTGMMNSGYFSGSITIGAYIYSFSNGICTGRSST